MVRSATLAVLVRQTIPHLNAPMPMLSRIFFCLCLILFFFFSLLFPFHDPSRLFVPQTDFPLLFCRVDDARFVGVSDDATAAVYFDYVT